jgi:hypothetical protein
MDKPVASRRQKLCPPNWLLAGLLLLTTPDLFAASLLSLSPADAMRIGRKVWQNECNGTIPGLTSWNVGENFASLGIGHFIWYPEGMEGPFEESFPHLVKFISERGVKLPTLLTGAAEVHCPWRTRAQFLRAEQTPEMKQLREFLVRTIDLQAQFLILRLENALPKMLEEAAPSERSAVEGRFERLANSSRGCFALVDYVNFKGEGVLHSERYNGHGWGLLQVLEQMHDTDSDPVEAFSRAAAEVLKRRVQDAPPERNESRWLSGWISRVSNYARA